MWFKSHDPDPGILLVAIPLRCRVVGTVHNHERILDIFSSSIERRTARLVSIMRGRSASNFLEIAAILSIIEAAWVFVAWESSESDNAVHFKTSCSWS